MVEIMISKHIVEIKRKSGILLEKFSEDRREKINLIIPVIRNRNINPIL
jgi:hypothetical protein